MCQANCHVANSHHTRYTTVLVKLTDPAYAPWFMKFSDAVIANHSLAHVPVCDNNYNPPRCSNLYHDQSQTPGYVDFTNGASANSDAGEHVAVCCPSLVAPMRVTHLQIVCSSSVCGSSRGSHPSIS